jgi:predicted amidohydrolase YtcJ
MFRSLVPLLLFVVANLQGQVADLVVENARIYTVNPQTPSAKALAIKNGRILAVGNEVNKHKGTSTKIINAQGATVIPGLIDSHVHLQNYGGMLESFDFRQVKTPEEIAAKVAAAANQRPKGEWIQGRAWDQTNWGGTFPTKAVLDAVTPDHPVVLRRVDGHATWVNSQALKLAGIDNKTPDPPGGKIVRDEKGEATGILIDRAMILVGEKVPAPTLEQVERRLRIAAEDCVKQGLTSIHDAGVDFDTIKAYENLVARNQMPLRSYLMIGGTNTSGAGGKTLWQEWLDRGPRIDSQLTIRALKLVADGAMGSGGAAFFQPYSDDKTNSGLLILSKEQVARASREAVAKGFQVCTHAIGDYANRTALDGYAEVISPNNEQRFRMEHAQIVSLPDFARFKKYNVIASIQATHATSDMRWALKKLGPDRLLGAYAWQRFLNNGVRIANGSDFPVESNKPLWGFYSAVTRQDHRGQPSEAFLPNERLTRAQALKSFTLDGAYAAFEEKEKGSLEVGKLADFVMLSKDIMEVAPLEILKTEILMTVIGGQTAYDARP